MIRLICGAVVGVEMPAGPDMSLSPFSPLLNPEPSATVLPKQYKIPCVKAIHFFFLWGHSPRLHPHIS